MTERDDELHKVAQEAAEEALKSHHDSIRSAVKEGISSALVRLGLDVNNPLESQADMQFLRSVRKGSQSARSKMILTAIGVAVTAAVALALSKLGALLK